MMYIGTHTEQNLVSRFFPGEFFCGNRDGRNKNQNRSNLVNIVLNYHGVLQWPINEKHTHKVHNWKNSTVHNWHMSGGPRAAMSFFSYSGFP